MLPPLEPLSASSYRLCCEEHPESLLQNPIALQKKYLKLKDDPSLKKTKSELHKAVKAGEQPALEMLLDLFDWLDGLEPQPTMEVFPLHEEPQNTEGRIADPLAQDNQVAGKRAKNTVSFHLACSFCLSLMLGERYGRFSNLKRPPRPSIGGHARQTIPQ